MCNNEMNLPNAQTWLERKSRPSWRYEVFIHGIKKCSAMKDRGHLCQCCLHKWILRNMQDDWKRTKTVFFVKNWNSTWWAKPLLSSSKAISKLLIYGIKEKSQEKYQVFLFQFKQSAEAHTPVGTITFIFIGKIVWMLNVSPATILGTFYREMKSSSQ